LRRCSASCSACVCCCPAAVCAILTPHACPYLYFCTSNASKLSTCKRLQLCAQGRALLLQRVYRLVMRFELVLQRVCQYLYFCTSKASKLRTKARSSSSSSVSTASDALRARAANNACQQLVQHVSSLYSMSAASKRAAPPACLPPCDALRARAAKQVCSKLGTVSVVNWEDLSRSGKPSCWVKREK
jgi:hypothetical protein